MFKREKRAVKTMFYCFGLNFEKPQVNSLNEGNTSSAHSNCASTKFYLNFICMTFLRCYFHMSPQITCIRGCIITLVACWCFDLPPARAKVGTIMEGRGINTRAFIWQLFSTESVLFGGIVHVIHRTGNIIKVSKVKFTQFCWKEEFLKHETYLLAKKTRKTKKAR